MNTFYPVVRVKRVNPDASMPVYAHEGDAGFDLCSMEDVTLAPGETVTVGTGIAVAIPDGYVGLVFPRSGLGSRGLTLSNCCGVIDSGYRGEIRAPLHNNHPSHKVVNTWRTSTSNDMCALGLVPKHALGLVPNAGATMHVSKGERVCQMLIMPYGQSQLKEVGELDETERGSSGMGSTGTGRL